MVLEISKGTAPETVLVAEDDVRVRMVLAGSIPRAARVASDLCDDRAPQPKRYEARAVVDRIRRLHAARAARRRARAS